MQIFNCSLIIFQILIYSSLVQLPEYNTKQEYRLSWSNWLDHIFLQFNSGQSQPHKLIELFSSAWFS